jgi:hypothetical protein
MFKFYTIEIGEGNCEKNIQHVHLYIDVVFILYIHTKRST